MLPVICFASSAHRQPPLDIQRCIRFPDPCAGMFPSPQPFCNYLIKAVIDEFKMEET